jgi:hypothetical protein
MSRLLFVPTALAVLAFAPAPFTSRGTDLDRALAQYEKDVQDDTGQNQAALVSRKKKLVDLLEKREADLRKRGKSAEADGLRDRVVLLASVDGGRPLGKTTAAALLKKAAVTGKYRKLLRVLYMPGDQASYGQFTDYGAWSGNAYNGETNLPAGSWVYVYPRWFIWGELGTP